MHPSMPPLARTWLPDRTGFATAVYANGLLIGEILPVDQSRDRRAWASWNARLHAGDPLSRSMH
jgi:hypothetical protein